MAKTNPFRRLAENILQPFYFLSIERNNRHMEGIVSPQNGLEMVWNMLFFGRNPYEKTS